MAISLGCFRVAVAECDHLQCDEPVQGGREMQRCLLVLICKPQQTARHSLVGGKQPAELGQGGQPFV